MPHYTIIAEHAGGTYVSQIPADSRDAALRIWLDDTDPETAAAYIHHNKRKHRTKLEEQLTGPIYGFSTLDGCVNVWQCLFRIRKANGTLHIIRTDQEAEQVEEEPSSSTPSFIDPP